MRRLPPAFLVLMLGLLPVFNSQSAAMDGLVLFMPLDEGSGQETRDISGNNNNGKLVGAPKWVDGKFGKALEFSGKENKNYVEIPDNPSLNPQSEITCTAWIYFNTFLGSGGIISKYIGAGNQRSYTIHTHHDNVNGLASDISSNGVYTLGVTAVSATTEAEALKPSEWQHIAMTYQAKKFIRLYVNGELKAEADAAAVSNLFDNEVPLMIGNDFQVGGEHRAGQPREFTGIIDEVAIFKRVLTNDEIITVMNGNLMPVRPQGYLASTWGDIKK